MQLLTAEAAHRVSALVLPRNTNPLITDIAATARPAPRMIANTKSDESATVAILENMMTRTAMQKSIKVHALELHQPIHHRGGVRTEAVVITTKKGTQNGAVTARTARIETGVGMKKRSTEAAESVQSRRRSPSTARADAPCPALT